MKNSILITNANDQIDNVQKELYVYRCDDICTKILLTGYYRYISSRSGPMVFKCKYYSRKDIKTTSSCLKIFRETIEFTLSKMSIEYKLTGIFFRCTYILHF